MPKPSPSDAAERLKSIYQQPFGGKERGRYKISRINLRILSERKRLENTFLDLLKSAAYDEQGLILEELEDYFVVILEDTMLNYRPVPKSVISKFVNVTKQRGGEYDED